MPLTALLSVVQDFRLAELDLAPGDIGNGVPAQGDARPGRCAGAEFRNAGRRVASDELTDLERETLTLFPSGRSYTRIAEIRAVSTVTVRNTLYRIQEKLGVGAKQELVIWAVGTSPSSSSMRAQ